jgi:Cu-Zn family superoxide dismutase
MDKLLRLALVITVVFSFTITVANAQVEIPEPKAGDLVATIIDSEGQEIGRALITEMQQEDAEDLEGLLLVAVMVWQGLEPGFHALHIHSTGTCEHSNDTPFSTANGHFNPDGITHGTHAGDLPSLYAIANGGSGLMYITDAFTMADLIDEDGSAVVIHAGRDNFGNIPERYGQADEATLGAGDAGARVACGVFEVQ